jgi:hypothetical protein
VRNRAALVNAWLTDGMDGLRRSYDGAFRPLCDDLAVIVAVDSETSIR